jgi:hypothetical protein
VRASAPRGCGTQVARPERAATRKAWLLPGKANWGADGVVGPCAVREAKHPAVSAVHADWVGGPLRGCPRGGNSCREAVE